MKIQRMFFLFLVLMSFFSFLSCPDEKEIGAKYPVCFEAKGVGGSIKATVNGTEIKSGDFVAENSRVIFEVALQEGYEIISWEGIDSVAPGAVTVEVLVNKSINIAVVPQKKSFKVSYSVEGNGQLAVTSKGSLIHSGDSLLYGEPLVFMATPIDTAEEYNTGYQWVNITADADNPLQATVASLTEDLEVKIVFFSSSDYRITYILNGGENVPENPTFYRKKATSPTLLVPPTYENHQFLGWFEVVNGVSTSTLISQIPVGSTGNRTFEAHWEIFPLIQFAQNSLYSYQQVECEGRVYTPQEISAGFYIAKGKTLTITIGLLAENIVIVDWENAQQDPLIPTKATVVVAKSVTIKPIVDEYFLLQFEQTPFFTYQKVYSSNKTYSTEEIKAGILVKKGTSVTIMVTLALGTTIVGWENAQQDSQNPTTATVVVQKSVTIKLKITSPYVYVNCPEEIKKYVTMKIENIACPLSERLREGDVVEFFFAQEDPELDCCFKNIQWTIEGYTVQTDPSNLYKASIKVKRDCPINIQVSYKQLFRVHGFLDGTYAYTKSDFSPESEIGRNSFVEKGTVIYFQNVYSDNEKWGCYPETDSSTDSHLVCFLQVENGERLPDVLYASGRIHKIRWKATIDPAKPVKVHLDKKVKVVFDFPPTLLGDFSLSCRLSLGPGSSEITPVGSAEFSNKWMSQEQRIVRHGKNFLYVPSFENLSNYGSLLIHFKKNGSYFPFEFVVQSKKKGSDDTTENLRGYIFLNDQSYGLRYIRIYTKAVFPFVVDSKGSLLSGSEKFSIYDKRHVFYVYWNKVDPPAKPVKFKYHYRTIEGCDFTSRIETDHSLGYCIQKVSVPRLAVPGGAYHFYVGGSGKGGDTEPPIRTENKIDSERLQKDPYYQTTGFFNFTHPWTAEVSAEGVVSVEAKEPIDATKLYSVGSFKWSIPLYEGGSTDDLFLAHESKIFEQLSFNNLFNLNSIQNEADRKWYQTESPQSGDQPAVFFKEGFMAVPYVDHNNEKKYKGVPEIRDSYTLHSYPSSADTFNCGLFRAKFDFSIVEALWKDRSLSRNKKLDLKKAINIGPGVFYLRGNGGNPGDLFSLSIPNSIDLYENLLDQNFTSYGVPVRLTWDKSRPSDNVLQLVLSSKGRGMIRNSFNCLWIPKEVPEGTNWISFEMNKIGLIYDSFNIPDYSSSYLEENRIVNPQKMSLVFHFYDLEAMRECFNVPDHPANLIPEKRNLHIHLYTYNPPNLDSNSFKNIEKHFKVFVHLRGDAQKNSYRYKRSPWGKWLVD